MDDGDTDKGRDYSVILWHRYGLGQMLKTTQGFTKNGKKKVNPIALFRL